MFLKKFLTYTIIVTFSSLIIISYYQLATPKTLFFSDSAKTADIAKNLNQDGRWGVKHSFFSTKRIQHFIPRLPGEPVSLFATSTMPFPPRFLSLIFNFFPAHDQTLAFSGSLLFVLSAVLLFSITKKLHSTKAGLVAVILFTLNPFFQEYAINFSTEILFIFEILLFIWLVLKTGVFRFLSLVPLLLMMFTRQQAVVFYAAIALTYFVWLISNKKISNSKKIIFSTSLLGLGLLVVYLSFKLMQLPISPASLMGSLYLPSGVPQGLSLRGFPNPSTSTTALVSKLFYNLYNFVKSPARLISPSIIFLFLLSIFSPSRNKNFTNFTTISLILFLTAVSITLPNARYIHPVIPLVIVVASIGLVDIIDKLKIKRSFLVLSLFLFITTASVWGNIFLDYRFRLQNNNLDQPPAYKKIASIMADNISPGQLIITNLDSWAAWYYNLSTVWFPLSPEILNQTTNIVKEETGFNKVEYIVITNYKEHDGDFALGDWAEVVYSPLEIENEFLTDNYSLLTTFEITADQVYENQSYQGTILISKTLESGFN